jgi:hypothetical protein
MEITTSWQVVSQRRIRWSGAAMTANWLDSAATFKKCTVSKVSFILLNQLDLTLTVLAISLGLVELNPLVRFLVEIPALLILVKLVIPVLIAWVMPGRLLLPSIALLFGVFIWNVKELIVFLS